MSESEGNENVQVDFNTTRSKRITIRNIIIFALKNTSFTPKFFIFLKNTYFAPKYFFAPKLFFFLKNTYFTPKNTDFAPEYFFALKNTYFALKKYLFCS